MTGLPNTVAGYRGTAFAALFAILLSMQSILVLCFGAVGIGGNSAFTGSLLAGCVLAIAATCLRRDIHLSGADYCFILFVASILASFLVNGQSSSPKECLLLAIALGAYAACRLATGSDLAALKPTFFFLVVPIVVAGTIATAVAVIQQWDDQHGKPFVFGFDAAPTHFLQLLSFLILAAVTLLRLTPRRAIVISALAFLPVAIFAASLVRFTFIALIGSLVVAAIFSRTDRRKNIVIIGSVLLVAMAAGLGARHAKAKILVDFSIESSIGTITWERPPSCDLTINPNNSIAIRKALTLDAIYLIPLSGPLGTGLDSFMKFTCIKLTEVHNSFLQAPVEFGWIGGALLLLSAILASVSLARLAPNGGVALFIFCCLAFEILLTMVHGRVSRDYALFALLGTAGALAETCRQRLRVRPAEA